MKRYRLKFDTIPPSWVHVKLCAGTIIELRGDRYVEPTSQFYWTRDAVENNEWYFEQIQDTPEQAKEGLWSDEDMINFAHYCSVQGSPFMFQKHIVKWKAYKQSQSNRQDNFHYSATIKSNTPKEEPKLGNRNLDAELKRLGIEEQPSKEWIVLSLIGEYGGYKDVRYDYNIATGFYVPELHQLGYGFPKWTLADVLNNHSGKIHSVRRLSDNEVFSVGDDIEWGKKGKILRLFISSNNLMWCDLKYEDGSEYHNANVGSLDKLPSTKPDMVRQNLGEEYSYAVYNQEQPSKERIKVLGFSFDKEPYMGKWGNVLKFYVPYSFEYEKEENLKNMPLITKAIENIIN